MCLFGSLLLQLLNWRLGQFQMWFETDKSEAVLTSPIYKEIAGTCLQQEFRQKSIPVDALLWYLCFLYGN